MGTPRPVSNVLLIVAAFSRHPAALQWAHQWAQSCWGPIRLESPQFSFNETTYYESSMGTGLQKCFFVFERLIDPASLAEIKQATNQAERLYAAEAGNSEERPLNLDPGYLTESKLVLASTKDHAHRIYLGQGIFAELTLGFRKGVWTPWDWTYPDYRRSDYHIFFDAARTFYRQQLMTVSGEA